MNKEIVWEDSELYIVQNPSEIPWLIVHPKSDFREFSQIPHTLRIKIMDILVAIEKELLEYYQPHKINIASFGNYLPRQHWHIMARFKEDSYFPEPMWGERQREAKLSLPPFDAFINRLKEHLNALD